MAMNMIKQTIITAVLSLALVMSGVFSTTALAAACKNDNAILGFPTWFHGLDCTDAKNGGQTVNVNSVGKVWVIALNILQWLMIAGGYVTLYFLIWGGIKFMTAAGEPDKIKNARETITNAIIGLIIVLAAVAIVRTIQGSISGSII